MYGKYDCYYMANTDVSESRYCVLNVNVITPLTQMFQNRVIVWEM
jgi:hypothetical protein